jgi:predicted Ser/Thr protein kinase
MESASQAPTVAMPRARTPTPSSSVEQGRFPPGTVLAERYQIIGLLGKGGMGEVYRANDLRLGQPVALKFLPAATGKNPQLLARFHEEVRIARQVSHPNVCRVYDIGEVDGSTFLSMEYVDGEDLSSLLRRIGRLPGDKAIEIARKLCAGLAAAHDKGVLHRDLKPANIMIDGRGQVLITDFGLAALAGQLDGAHLREGTPAYMAPEQLAGEEVSVRSDIYALGLVLHEMLTGKRAFEDGSQRTAPTAVTSLAKDIDPVVERVILRCLDLEPRHRPASALAVAAALPGGDPLAAALAAGDMPTPAMVAASGDTEGISVRTAGICLVWIVAGLAAVAMVGAKTNVVRKTPFPNSPDILAQKAREIIQSFGYATAPTADRAYGFTFDTAYQSYAEKQGDPAAYREQLAKGQPPLIYFWYRQSPQPLVINALTGDVSPGDPPPTVSGMIGLNLDPQGRLLQLDAVPPQVEENSPLSASSLAGSDWKTLFAAAGLDMDRFRSVDPKWISLAPFDARAAWTGSYLNASEIPLRIEAASWRGKPVFFQIVGPWSRPERMQQSAGPSGSVLLFFAVLVLGGFLAWRNFRTKKGDIRGGNRAAAFGFTVEWLGFQLSAHHVAAADEWRVLFSGTVNAVLVAAGIWTLYLALEPYVRRRWPQSMISWSRMLRGEFRDPLVGGHLLFGVAAGIGLGLIHSGGRLAAEHSGLTSVQLLSTAYSANANLLFSDTRGLAGGLLLELINKFLAGLALTFLLMLLRVLFRRQWLTATALILLYAFGGFGLGGFGARSAIVGINAVLFASLFAATLLRFGGLLPTIVCFFVGNDLTDPLIADLSAWYASTTVFVLVVVLALTAYAFHTAVAGRPLFKAGFLDPD